MFSPLDDPLELRRRDIFGKMLMEGVAISGNSLDP
jgi:hypothetical protein